MILRSMSIQLIFQWGFILIQGMKMVQIVLQENVTYKSC